MVTLINCFEVPADRDDAFLALWSEVNRYMRQQPGYRSHRLHRAASAQARYRYVNVADWDSKEQFEAAHGDEFRKLLSKAEWREFTSTPNLFQVVHENQA